MKPTKNGLFNMTNAETTIEFLDMPTIEVKQDRYDEFIRKEAQLEFVKKWLKDKAIYPQCVNISDLLILLDIEKERYSK